MHDGDCLVVASTRACPHASPEEKPELWREMAAIWPAFDDCQERTDRDIPVVVLERAA